MVPAITSHLFVVPLPAFAFGTQRQAKAGKGTQRHAKARTGLVKEHKPRALRARERAILTPVHFASKTIISTSKKVRG